MNILHKLEYRNQKLQMVLYAYYPAEYEFALDFNSLKVHVSHVTQSIKQYVRKHKEDFKTASILLILNGVIIGSVYTTNLLNEKNTDLVPHETYQDVMKNQKPNIPDTIQIAKAELVEDESESKEETPSNDSNIYSNTNTVGQGMVIPIQLENGSIVQMNLEDYVVGVVAAEMPAVFDIEALKAQAIACRTYALKKVAEGTILNTTSQYQNYQNENELKNKWGDSFDTYYTKVQNAVYSTQGICVTYNGNYIDALYFAISNGKTEDPIHVWGFTSPYLKSVESGFESSVRGFASTVNVSKSDFAQKLGVSLEDLNHIEIIEKTTGNRVKTLVVGNQTFDGVKIRSLFGLRSADFTISTKDDSITFQVKGYGHGVGMSQYGANELAKQGYNYESILHYYYTGVSVQKMV